MSWTSEENRDAFDSMTVVECGCGNRVYVDDPTEEVICSECQIALEGLVGASPAPKRCRFCDNLLSAIEAQSETCNECLDRGYASLSDEDYDAAEAARIAEEDAQDVAWAAENPETVDCPSCFRWAPNECLVCHGIGTIPVLWTKSVAELEGMKAQVLEDIIDAQLDPAVTEEAFSSVQEALEKAVDRLYSAAYGLAQGKEGRPAIWL